MTGSVPAAAVGAPVAQNDLAAWKANLAAALPGGDGSVTVNGADNTMVTVEGGVERRAWRRHKLEFQTVTRI